MNTPDLYGNEKVIGFYVVVTKPNKHKITTRIINDTGKSMEEIKNKIVYIMQEEIEKLEFSCDFPDSYEKFINTIWYSSNSADAEPFEYKVFDHNNWVAPWDPEDLFNDAVEILHKIQVLDAMIVDANKNEEEFEDSEVDEVVDETVPKKTTFEELKEFFAETN